MTVELKIELVRICIVDLNHIVVEGNGIKLGVVREDSITDVFFEMH